MFTVPVQLLNAVVSAEGDTEIVAPGLVVLAAALAGAAVAAVTGTRAMAPKAKAMAMVQTFLWACVTM